MKKLYLVDVSSMFFRAFFAIPPLNNGKGLPTNALHGFLNMTVKLLRDIKPDYLAFCFDRQEPSFRYELYEDYKANREEMPDDLKPQMPYLRKLTQNLGIPYFDREGYEADDVIGSFTKWGRQRGLEVVIVSGDKDFAQLIGPHVSMFDTMKDVRYDEKGVVEKWGVKPEQMIDYLALVGDSSDNIPGVRGIGPKGAQKLLSEFNTLDGIYQHLDDISGKSLKEKLTEHKKMAYLSQKLVTIHCDLDFPFEPSELVLRPVKRAELIALLEELGFKNFLRTLVPEADGQIVDLTTSGAKKAAPKTKEKVGALKEKKPESKPVSDDVFQLTMAEEDHWQADDLQKIEPYSDVYAFLTERGLALAYGSRVSYVSMNLIEAGQLLNRKHLGWKGYDLKEVWRALGLKNPGTPVWDSMLAAYVVRARTIEEFEKTYDYFTDRMVPDLADVSQLYKCHVELEKILKKRVEEVHGEKILKEFDQPLEPVLLDMETQGVCVDSQVLEELSRELTKDIQKIEKAIHKKAGEEFNVGSPKQLGHILFEKLKLPAGRKTKTGYSTDSDVLETLAAEHPIAADIIEYREWTKLKSTYADALPQLIDKATGKIHTRFRQAATTTGRLSSVNPNLQNIPIRTDRGRLVRRAFIAAKGNVLISVDYSQIELRVLAHIADDAGLKRAFADDLDIHAATASEIFEVPLDEVNSDLRRKAKAVNFGIAYGQGAFGLSQTLGIERGEATEIITRYFKKFKGVKDYMESTIKTAHEKGYVETLFGRRRYLEELRSANQALRKFGERAAINAPIQGTASDLVRLAMIRVHESVSIPIVLQVHDELLFECPAKEVEEHSHDIKKIMENVVQLKVPLRVNVAWGANWDEAH